MKKIILLSILGFVSQSALAEAIADNSFLVEEAYNQERGVVQFIQSWNKPKDGKTWAYNFTTEIPVPDERHQFSFEIPVGRTAADKTETEVADVKLNYRHEVVNNKDVVATARLSTTLPTGDEKKGLGAGAAGAEVAMVSSVMVNQKWVQHFNLGFGFTPSAKDGAGSHSDLQKYFWGFSNIYLYSDNLNFMLEVVGTHAEEVAAGNQAVWGQTTLISPAVRYAIDYSGWQFVPGLAIPLSVGAGEHDTNFYAYLSIEGKLF